MKRSDKILGIAALAVVLALLFYVGYTIYDRVMNPFETYLAAAYTVVDGAEVTGWAVRGEEVLTAHGLASASSEDGSRIGAGQIIARIYRNEEDLDRADEIYELQLELARLEAELEPGVHEPMDPVSALARLAASVASPSLADLDNSLKNAGFSLTGELESYDEDTLRAGIQYRLDRIAILQSMQKGVQTVTAQRTGLFTSQVDGFEFVTPAALDSSLSPSMLEALFSQPQSTENAFGKLIGGTTWYYAAVMDSESAARLKLGASVNLAFTHTYSGTISMKVASVSRPEDGRCTVVFSSTRYMADTASLRQLQAQVVFAEQEGLRVPRQALRLDESGQTYVYVVSGIQARRVNVTVLAETGDFYLLAPAKRLYDATEVILRCNDLYDGKVVR